MLAHRDGVLFVERTYQLQIDTDKRGTKEVGTGKLLNLKERGQDPLSRPERFPELEVA